MRRFHRSLSAPSRRPSTLGVDRTLVICQAFDAGLGRERRTRPDGADQQLSRPRAAVGNSELVLYPDAGHSGIFQYHGEFVGRALAFLQP
jgi:hypothetical protein